MGTGLSTRERRRGGHAVVGQRRPRAERTMDTAPTSGHDPTVPAPRRGVGVPRSALQPPGHRGAAVRHDGGGEGMSTLGLRVDQVLTTTRAVRKRLDLDRPVEPEVIRDCLEIALQAPSGSNNQSWHFVVVMDEDRRAEVAAVYRKAFADYEAGPLNPARMPADDADQHAAQQRVFRSAAYLAQHLHRVPCLLVPVATGRVERLTSA